MAEFRMPSLGADMTEGTLLEWLVAPGDVVHRGDIVAVVDTSKSAIDIEVFQDGTVRALLVEPGTTVAVGTPLALLSGPTDSTASEPPSTITNLESPAPAPTPGSVSGQANEVTSGPGGQANEVTSGPGGQANEVTSGPSGREREGRIAASPFARRRAAELGLDLAEVQGHGGVISVVDVEAAAGSRAERASAGSTSEPAAATPPAEPTTPDAGQRATAMREAIGRLMARSKREIPHYYLQTTFDMQPALQWLAEENAGRSVAQRILPAALLLKAAAVSARDVPGLNGFFIDGAFTASSHVHLGVAVSLRGGGLIAPALHDADTLSIADVMAGMKDLVTRARSGRLRSSEMSDPTITVTNLGEQGAEAVHGVIYPPQVALVGFGRIVERPWAIDGMLTVRPVVTVTLAADHRVTDGHRGGLFLDAIGSALADPTSLRGGGPT